MNAQNKTTSHTESAAAKTNVPKKYPLIGIFGGSFDPVHNGHLMLAKQLMQILPLNHLYFVPCKKNVLKTEVPSASEEDRINMLDLALKPFKKISVDRREIDRQTPSYTVETLKSFREETGDEAALCFILSSDAFQRFDQWRHWRQILKLAHLIIVKRPGYSLLHLSPELQSALDEHRIKNPLALQEKTAGAILVQPLARKLPISATSIRHAIASRLTLNGQLPKAVYHYIQKHQLYR